MENYNNEQQSAKQDRDVNNPWNVSPEDLTKDDSGNVIPKTYIQDADEAHDLANTANRLRDESMNKTLDSLWEAPYDKNKVYENVGEEGINWTVGTAGSVLDLMKQTFDNNGSSISSVTRMGEVLSSLKRKNAISEYECRNIQRALNNINEYVNNNLVRTVYLAPDVIGHRQREYYDIDTGAKRDTRYDGSLIITPDDVVKYAKSRVEAIEEARRQEIHNAGDRAVAEAEHSYDYEKRIEPCMEKIESAKEQLLELASGDKEVK